MMNAHTPRILIRHQSRRAAAADSNAERCDSCRHFFQFATMITRDTLTLCTGCAITELQTKERTAP